MKNYITTNSMIELYKQYMPSQKLKDIQIVKYIKYLCDKFDIDNGSDKKGTILIQEEDLKIIEELLKKIKLFYEDPSLFYSIEEIGEKLNLKRRSVDQILLSKRIEVDIYIKSGASYKPFVSKNKIDTIENIRRETILIKSVQDFLGIKATFVNITNFIKKSNIEIVELPHRYGMRIYKKDLPMIKDAYSIDLDKYYTTKQINKKYNTSIKMETLVKYVKNTVIYKNTRYFNKEEVDDIIKFKNTPKSLRKINDEYKLYNDKYYTFEQVKNKYDINFTAQTLKKHIKDFELYKGTLFFNRDEVDRLIEFKNKFITIEEARKELSICRNTINKLIVQNNIESIIMSNSKCISKSDFENISNIYNKLQKIDSMKDGYEKFEIIINDIGINNNAPKTIDIFREFVIKRFNDFKHKKHVLRECISLYSNTLTLLSKEIYEYNDEAIYSLLKLMNNSGKTREEFIYFLKYINSKIKTKYSKNLKYIGRQSNNKENSNNKAFTEKQWLEFAKLIFINIDNKEFLTKALDSRVNAMIWLYCAMHYCTTWRYIDYRDKLPIPNLELILGIKAENFIAWIKSGNTFTYEMGQAICNYVILKIRTFEKSHSKNEENLTFEIGNMLVRPIGFLIALCESHRVKEEKEKNFYTSNTNSLITKTVQYPQHHIKFFGEKYIEIFGNRSFANISAVKTHLHMILSKSSEKGWSIGYYLASISRGHSKNTSGFAQSTQIYLRDINKDNDLDKVTYNLYERGTFGFIQYKLLSVIYGDEFRTQDISNQTEMIQELTPLSPGDIEIIVKDIVEQRFTINEIIQELLATDKDKVVEVLKKIAFGEIPSKMEHSQCFIKAFKKYSCIYPSREHCIGCKYLIPEMYFLLEFNNMLQKLLSDIRSSTLAFDKQRHSYILNTYYLPLLNEASKVLGLDRVKSFINIKKLKEDIKLLIIEKKLIMG